MSEHCKARVYSPGSFSGHHCSNRAKKDGYCMIHHPEVAKERQRKSKERSDYKWKRYQALWKMKSARDIVLDCVGRMDEPGGLDDLRTAWQHYVYRQDIFKELQDNDPYKT